MSFNFNVFLIRLFPHFRLKLSLNNMSLKIRDIIRRFAFYPFGGAVKLPIELFAAVDIFIYSLKTPLAYGLGVLSEDFIFKKPVKINKRPT